MPNINRVVLVGNLTKDPELRHTPSGTAVCKLRLAVNTRQKDATTGGCRKPPNRPVPVPPDIGIKPRQPCLDLR